MSGSSPSSTIDEKEKQEMNIMKPFYESYYSKRKNYFGLDKKNLNKSKWNNN